MQALHVYVYYIRHFYSNEQVANNNNEQQTKLEHPIAHVNARHSSASTKKISSDDTSGLQHLVFLAKGARVMLTMNLWSLQWGYWNSC